MRKQDIKAGTEHAAELERRALAVIAALGVTAVWHGPPREQVIMSLRSAEKLASLLESKNGNDETGEG